MRLAVIVVNNISDSNVHNPIAIGTSVESTQAWTGFGIEGNKYILSTGEEVSDKKFASRIQKAIRNIEDNKGSGQIIGTIVNNETVLEIQVRTVH